MTKIKGIRVNSTFHPTIEKFTKAYAHCNGISFSEAIEKLTAKTVTSWWNGLKMKQRAEYLQMFKEFDKK